MLGNAQAYVLKKIQYKYLELFGLNPKIVFFYLLYVMKNSLRSFFLCYLFSKVERYMIALRNALVIYDAIFCL